MNKVTTIGKKEQENIARRTAMVRAEYELHSLEEAKDLYLKASEIATLAGKAIKDGLQGKSLLYAKKDICDNEWNAARMTKPLVKKWQDFLTIINCSAAQASYLLSFAGYQTGDEGVVLGEYRL